MNDFRYETHIACDPLLPFVLDDIMTLTPDFFNPVPNWHDDLEILNCREGEGYVIMDGKRVDFSAGDTVIICPFVIHNVYSDSSVSFFPVTPGRDFCVSNGIDTDRLVYPEKIRDAEMNKLSRELESHYHSSDYLRTANIRRTVLNMMINLTEKYGRLPDETSNGKKADFIRVRNVIRFIRDNYGRGITLDEIARYSGINKYTVSRDFKELTGMTIVSYLNNYRCRIARERICSGMSVSEAAEICGFTNLSYFSRTFRKYVGELPSKNRT